MHMRNEGEIHSISFFDGFEAVGGCVPLVISDRERSNLRIRSGLIDA